MGLISKQCVDFVKRFEGFYPKPYYDIVGVKTLGYGMTGKEIEGLSSVTEPQASKMLENLLNNKYATPIKQDLDKKGVKLNQNQFDALVSMAYNVGYSGVLGSTLYKNICNGVRDKAIITANFEMWSMAGGEQVYGLLRRRREEAAMFFGSSNTSSGGSSFSSSIGGSYYNVKEVQNMLIKIGYPCGNAGADGIWGNDTYIAVKSFQKDCNLKSDGWVGNDTYHRIEAEYNKKMNIKSKQEIKEEEFDMDKVVLYFGALDALSAVLVSQKYQCPMMLKKDFEDKKLKSKEIITIGGKPNTDRYDSFKDAAKLV